MLIARGGGTRRASGLQLGFEDRLRGSGGDRTCCWVCALWASGGSRACCSALNSQCTLLDGREPVTLPKANMADQIQLTAQLKGSHSSPGLRGGEQGGSGGGRLACWQQRLQRQAGAQWAAAVGRAMQVHPAGVRRHLQDTMYSLMFSGEPARVRVHFNCQLQASTSNERLVLQFASEGQTSEPRVSRTT